MCVLVRLLISSFLVKENCKANMTPCLFVHVHHRCQLCTSRRSLPKPSQWERVCDTTCRWELEEVPNIDPDITPEKKVYLYLLVGSC